MCSGFQNKNYKNYIFNSRYFKRSIQWNPIRHMSEFIFILSQLLYLFRGFNFCFQILMIGLSADQIPSFKIQYLSMIEGTDKLSTSQRKFTKKDFSFLTFLIRNHITKIWNILAISNSSVFYFISFLRCSKTETIGFRSIQGFNRKKLPFLSRKIFIPSWWLTIAFPRICSKLKWCTSLVNSSSFTSQLRNLAVRITVDFKS